MIIINKILLIILIIIIIITLYENYNRKIEGLDTFNGRQAINDMYFYYKMFDDVTYYQNKSDFEFGMDECIEKCIGYCVEYGITGNAYCFPY